MKKTFKIIIWVLAVLVFFAIIIGAFVLVTFKTNLWLYYPNPFKTQAAFSKLEISSYDSYCREDCMFERNFLRKMVADYLVKNPVAIEKQIKRYFFDSEVNSSFKNELVLILKKAEEMKKEADEGYEIKMPDYLLEYLNEPGANIHVKRSVMASFRNEMELSGDFLNGLLEVIKDEGADIDERILAMQDLWNIVGEEEEGSREKEGGPFPKYANIDYENIRDMFMSMAENENDQRTKYKALYYMNGCIKFKKYYTEEIFNRLEKLFYQEGLSVSTQDEILTYLYIYSDIDENKSIEAMKKIYNNPEIKTAIRLIASWHLTELGLNDYPEPEISDEEWDDYIKIIW